MESVEEKDRAKKADKLFEQALNTIKRSPGSVAKNKRRAFNAAIRAGFGNQGSLDESLNLEKIHRAIRDGSVWDIRLAGPVTVRILCEWVAAGQVDFEEVPDDQA